jgi:LPPG:FO 2-phospho-L-lactate transferase
MRTCVLAGGVGSARFLTGLVRVVEPAELVVIVNTGDDDRMRGLHVSPDLDTVLYHLSDLTDWERGWGVTGETFVANERYVELVGALDGGVDMQEWFGLGDRDLATHMVRTRLLDEGWTLTAATDALRRAMGIAARVLPMTDDPVATMITTADGQMLDFQTYFVRHHHDLDIASIDYRGIGEARPSDSFRAALTAADVVLIPPSNPLLSVGPILALDGVRDAVSAKRTVAVSPIVGGRAIKGPAERVMASFGHDVSAVGVARLYQGVASVFVLDRADEASADEVAALGMEPLVTDTIMTGPEAAARLCKEILALA